MMVWLLFIIDLMGLFLGSIISIGDLPTTNIIEPKKEGERLLFYKLVDICCGIMFKNDIGEVV